MEKIKQNAEETREKRQVMLKKVQVAKQKQDKLNKNKNDHKRMNQGNNSDSKENVKIKNTEAKNNLEETRIINHEETKSRQEITENDDGEEIKDKEKMINKALDETVVIESSTHPTKKTDVPRPIDLNCTYDKPDEKPVEPLKKNLLNKTHKLAQSSQVNFQPDQ